MKTSLLTPIAARTLFAFAPSTAAYTFGNTLVEPLYGPAYRPSTTTTSTVQTTRGNQEYYGTPVMGVQRLRTTYRDQLLQQLEQRVINLQKLRNRSDVSPEYTRELRIYERILRRVDNTGLEHYRSPGTTNSRMMWRDGTLMAEPAMTPERIHSIVDEYEYNRAMLTTPNDVCSRYSGARQATCRYQMRVNDRIQR